MPVFAAICLVDQAGYSSVGVRAGRGGMATAA
jgi:hypothetical protein